MSYRRFTQFSVATLLLLTAIVAVVVPFLRVPNNGEGYDIEERSEYVWYDNAAGVAEKIYDGSWAHHTVVPGNGTHLSLMYGTHLVGTFDGNSYYQLNIQLPPKLNVGDTVDVYPIATKRAQSTRSGEEHHSHMNNGEVTAFQFCNPMMDWMTDQEPARIGTVKIISLTKNTATVRIKLIAPLDDVMDLEINDQFELARRNPNDK